jgi:hypothetical protein
MVWILVTINAESRKDLVDWGGEGDFMKGLHRKEIY